MIVWIQIITIFYKKKMNLCKLSPREREFAPTIKNKHVCVI